ncbi:MAG: sodium/hydrogen exchanger [Comamonadaceae bacterium]|nr:MAG: sodium/hydrogen exchanger [Comamonadaceae bacterium]
MTSPQWFLLIGALLLVRGLSATLVQRSPFTAAMMYLAFGVLVGPTVLNLFHFNPLKESALLQALTEVAVLISLFSAGVKMPAPFSLTRWRAPMLLATASMAVTVALITAFAYFLLDLPLGLGAILAPTDPVLATDVQIRHPGDRDLLRFTLTCEAGMNDGSAFPFVMLGLGLLGLHDLGHANLHWLVVEVLWATLGAVAIGVAAGVLLARIGWKLRREPHQHQLMDDFLGLGLIGVVYGLCVMLNTWGFLAVFFAAVALRQTELKLAKALRPSMDEEPMPTVSEGALVFKEHLERLSEVLLILLIGGTLFLDSWTWEAVGLALFLFVVVRPLSVLIGLAGTATSWRIRGLAGWFGVRGIGSLYYLMYAIEHKLPESLALRLIQLTLIVVTLSILLHGISVKPLMGIFWRRNQAREPAAAVSNEANPTKHNA